MKKDYLIELLDKFKVNILNFYNSFWYFFDDLWEKKHNYENHQNWFLDKMKMNLDFSKKNNKNDFFKKYSIYEVDFWMNIWEEMNWKRPALFLKKTNKTYWDLLLVLPIVNAFDSEKNIILNKWEFSVLVSSELWKLPKWFFKDSFILVNQIKSISKSRVSKWKYKYKYLWKLDVENDFDKRIILEIEKKIEKLFWILK